MLKAKFKGAVKRQMRRARSLHVKWLEQDLPGMAKGVKGKVA
jgi:hypothetical protein